MITIGEYKKEDNLTKETLQYSAKRAKKFRIFSFFVKVIKILSKLLWSCIILVAISHFVPEVKTLLPELYKFIEDFILKFFNDCFNLVNNFIF